MRKMSKKILANTVNAPLTWCELTCLNLTSTALLPEEANSRTGLASHAPSATSPLCPLDQPNLWLRI